MKKEGLTETLNVKTILLSLLMLLLPPGELFLFYFMNDTDTGSFLTGFITLGMLLLVFVFVFLTGLYQKTFLYNNGAHPERLLGVYCAGASACGSQLVSAVPALAVSAACRDAHACIRAADRDRRLSDPVISAGADQSAPIRLYLSALH